jgi:hypothetical protein
MPVWEQVNSNGFGTAQAVEVSALAVFNGSLYAGTNDPVNKARVYRYQGGVTWTPVSRPGFGEPHDIAATAVLDLAVFGGRLYASTGLGDGVGQIWRSVNGSTWAPVVHNGFSDPDNRDITTLDAWGGYLFAGTGHQSTGARIYRSMSGDSNSWTQVAPATPGTGAGDITDFAAFGGALYAAVESDGPAQIWRSAGGAWSPVMSNGFGSNQTTLIGGMASFGGYLYAGAGNTANSAQLWRTNNGTNWTQVNTNGFGDPNNRQVESVLVFQNQLYISMENTVAGIEVWRWANSANWEQVNPNGFGDPNNTSSNANNAIAGFLGGLYLGTSNTIAGGELWRTGQQSTYLPLVRH